jgi:hypothetical protein
MEPVSRTCLEPGGAIAESQPNISALSRCWNLAPAVDQTLNEAVETQTNFFASVMTVVCQSTPGNRHSSDHRVIRT